MKHIHYYALLLTSASAMLGLNFLGINRNFNTNIEQNDQYPPHEVL